MHRAAQNAFGVLKNLCLAFVDKNKCTSCVANVERLVVLIQDKNR